ncbi:MAG: hypothetical protein IKT57_03635 [Clostridia bacterium]|nr:hypothetical protein [Clostridia bacterium]
MQRAFSALLGALTGTILIFPREAFAAAENALTLFSRRVAPSLFPMMMVLLLLSSRMPARKELYALLSLLSGSPGGSRLCASLPLDMPAKRRFAALTGTLSPMFLLSAVPGIMELPSGIPLLICHLAGAALACLFIPKKKGLAGQMPATRQPLSLAAAAIEAGKSLLIVCGCMVFSGVLLEMIKCALPFLPDTALTLLHLLTEITGGLQTLKSSALPHQSLLCVYFASFGGLSILMQNAAFWQKGGVGLSRLFLYRIIHALISTTLYAVLCCL